LSVDNVIGRPLGDEMRNSLRAGSFALLITAPLLLGMAAPAGAGTGVPKIVHHAVAARLDTVPSANLAARRANEKFKPGRLAAQEFTADQCSSGSVSFVVNNPSTKTTYVVTYQGSPLFTVAPGGYETVCVYGLAKLQLGISGSAHVLNVKLHA
jgi:hypothetical protein